MKSDYPERDEIQDVDVDMEEAEGSAAGESEAPPEAAGEEEAMAAEPARGGERELEDLRDRYLRLAAEYENFRKRTDRERTESWDRAQGQLVEKLLEPLDDLQRVARAGGDAATLDALLEGVRMVERKLVRVLEAAGLEPMDARGRPFDPELHEALMMAPTSEADEDDTVGEVFQDGYRFRGALLRPARVQVKKHAGD